MKRGALALGVVLVLAIGWLAWSSRGTNAPAVLGQTPVASTPQSIAADAPAASVSESVRTPLEAETKANPNSAPAAPTATEPESAGILVRGTVRDEKGDLVASVGLNWTDELGVVTRAGVTDGSYSVPGLHPGHWILELSGWGWRTEQFDIELQPQPEVQQHDLTAHACTQIPIKLVHADGTLAFGEGANVQPGNRVRVIASKRQLSTLAAAARDSIVYQSDCGRFSNRWELRYQRSDLPADLFGILELRADPPICVALVLGSVVLQERVLNEIPAELVFQLRDEELESALCGLRVRIVQADGHSPVQRGSAMLQDDSITTVDADADGRVELHGLRPGWLALRLSGEGHPSVKRSIELEPGSVLDLGDVALTPAPKLRLHFEFPGEESQVLFVFKPEQPGDPLATLGTHDNTSFGNGGKNPYDLSTFGPGSYLLRVAGFGDPRNRESLRLGARPLRVVLVDGIVNEYRVRIEPTTEICLRPPHEATGLSRWLVSTADGLPCRRVRIEGRAPTRIELVPGEYTIARIDPDTNALGKPQAFTVGSAFLTLELVP